MEKGSCPDCGRALERRPAPVPEPSARPLLTFTFATASGVLASVHLLMTQNDSLTWVLTAGPIMTTALASLLSWISSVSGKRRRPTNEDRKEG